MVALGGITPPVAAFVYTVVYTLKCGPCCDPLRFSGWCLTAGVEGWGAFVAVDSCPESGRNCVPLRTIQRKQEALWEKHQSVNYPPILPLCLSAGSPQNLVRLGWARKCAFLTSSQASLRTSVLAGLVLDLSINSTDLEFSSVGQ